GEPLDDAKLLFRPLPGLGRVDLHDPDDTPLRPDRRRQHRTEGTADGRVRGNQVRARREILEVSRLSPVDDQRRKGSGKVELVLQAPVDSKAPLPAKVEPA